MAFTSYLTINGRIHGEVSGGVAIGYATDALGSVTATVDSTGNIANTYRYKPYGAILAKNGSTTDPRNLWVGSYGYRATGRTQSESYVRARHYGQQASTWSTTDSAWPNMRSYVYSLDNPSNMYDISGKYPQKTRPRSSKTVRKTKQYIPKTCGLYVCTKWAIGGYYGLFDLPTHRYICSEGPLASQRCAGGLYGSSIPGTGEVNDDGASCQSRWEKEGQIRVDCEVVSQNCEASKYTCDCINFFRNHPPVYFFPIYTCWAFARDMLGCGCDSIRRHYEEEKKCMPPDLKDYCRGKGL